MSAGRKKEQNFSQKLVGTPRSGIRTAQRAVPTVPSWREPNRQLHRRVFGMKFSVAHADEQIRLRPGLVTKPFGQIVRAHQAEQRHERRVAFAENYWTFADDDQ